MPQSYEVLSIDDYFGLGFHPEPKQVYAKIGTLVATPEGWQELGAIVGTEELIYRESLGIFPRFEESAFPFPLKRPDEWQEIRRSVAMIMFSQNHPLVIECHALASSLARPEVGWYYRHGFDIAMRTTSLVKEEGITGAILRPQYTKGYQFRFWTLADYVT